MEIKAKLGDQEWSAIYQSVDGWFVFLDKTLECVGVPLKEAEGVLTKKRIQHLKDKPACTF